MDDKLKDKAGGEDEAAVGTASPNGGEAAESIQESQEKSPDENAEDSPKESEGVESAPVLAEENVQEHPIVETEAAAEDQGPEEQGSEDQVIEDQTSEGQVTEVGDEQIQGPAIQSGPQEKQPEADLEFISGPDMPVKKKKRWKLAVGIVLLVLLLAAGGAYGAGIYYFQDKFLPNTTINGIDASYALPEEIEKQIAARVKEYKIQVESRGGKKETLTSDQIGYHYVSNGEVDGFKKSQNLYKWPFSFWDTFTYTFESGTAYEEDQFNQAVGNLDCMQPENMAEPKDAYMEFDTKDSEYVIVPEEQGAKLDTDKVKQVIGEAVTKSEDNISLEKKECYLKPAVTSNDKALNRLVTKLNKYCHTRIEYVFGENREVLDGATINSWVSYDDKGNVTLDEEQVMIFVQGLAEKYDTYDKPREFRTNDGSYVTVNGGSYGWMIDQEMEIQELTALIQSGAQTERYAAFAQTALSWDNSDLGWDYIEIDLTKQHIWMYIGGEVAVESDFVSGDIRSSDKATPEGTYTLYYKKSPDVLKSDKPGDSYRTPVTYWMPFNGGVGMHDATWRGSFGGNIYTYDGSHGCINLPYDIAGQIYNLIYDGFPIICFYR